MEGNLKESNEKRKTGSVDPKNMSRTMNLTVRSSFIPKILTEHLLGQTQC